MARRAVARTGCAASARRCRSPSGASSSAASRSPASRRSRASSPRTRSCSTSAQRGGWWMLYVAGYVGAVLTAIYTWRMIFRAFWGEPCPEARELEDGHLHHAPQPVQPGQRRDRGHRRRLPGPRAPHRRAGAADEGRDGRARGARDRSAASSRSRGSTRAARDVPRADVRRLDRCTSTRATALDAFGLVLGTVLGARRHLHRLRDLGGPARDAASACASASRRCTSSSSTSGTSTSSSTSSIVRPFAWFGRFGRRPFERIVVNGALVGGTTGHRARRLGRRARAADRLPARLRRAARASASSPSLFYFLIQSS